MSTTQSIRNAISNLPQSTLFASVNFLSLGKRAAIDQALYRMMTDGDIERVARGLYAVKGQGVASQTVAASMAHKTGEHLGFISSDKDACRLTMATTGQSRTVKTQGATVTFRRMSQRKIQLCSSPAGHALLELWMIGEKHITQLDIQRVAAKWPEPEKEFEPYAQLLPAWLRNDLQKTMAPRKSVKIGLSGLYDWSNRQIRDDVLIKKVLERHHFEDLARLCMHYGLRKVKTVFKSRDFHPMTKAIVKRMLSNISKGLKNPKETSHA